MLSIEYPHPRRSHKVFEVWGMGLEILNCACLLQIVPAALLRDRGKFPNFERSYDKPSYHIMDNGPDHHNYCHMTIIATHTSEITSTRYCSQDIEINVFGDSGVQTDTLDGFCFSITSQPQIFHKIYPGWLPFFSYDGRLGGYYHDLVAIMHSAIAMSVGVSRCVSVAMATSKWRAISVNRLYFSLQ